MPLLSLPTWGEDSVRPFLDHADRWSIVLALTSNPSAGNFETIADAEGMPLYQRVVRLSRHWGSPVKHNVCCRRHTSRKPCGTAQARAPSLLSGAVWAPRAAISNRWWKTA